MLCISDADLKGETFVRIKIVESKKEDMRNGENRLESDSVVKPTMEQRS
jgi:hypothetical protein